MLSLRKSLMRDIRFNAFNDAFDKELLFNEVEAAIRKGFSFEEVSPAVFSPLFNSVYVEFYNKAKEIIEHKILTRDEFEQLMLANINRETLMIQSDMERAFFEQTKDTGRFIIGESSNFKVKSGILDRDVYAIDGVENSLDAINIVFSYLKYKERVDTEEPLDEEKAKHHLFVLNMLGNQVAALKNTYDAMIWRNGYIHPDKETDTLLLKLKDKALTLSFVIGKFRIDQATSADLMQSMTLINNNESFKNLIKKAFRFKRKPRSIESVFVEDGYINYKIKKGFSKNHIRYDAKLQSSISMYYDFIEYEILPSTDKLTVQDIAVMYAELCELLSEIQINWGSGNEVMSIDDFYEFPFRMKIGSLIQFMSSKTTYTIKEIKSFIDMLTHHPEERVNLWKRPFIKQGNDLLFSILSISSANTLYIIDEWLLAGGYSLDGRGPIFEKHLKKEIQEKMDKKGYMCKIHPNSMLRINDKQKEEIDLIAEFSDCILVAEVKCVSYPTEARDHYNSHKRFEEGANQLNRKVKFLEKHKDVFSKEIPGLAHKPIVKAVFANYPLLTGYSIEGVPCSDINSLGHYISEGAIDKGLISSDFKGNRDTSRAEHVVYYTNEKEFCENLHKHLSNPVSFQSIQEICFWEDIELSSKGASPKIIIEAVKIRQDQFLDKEW